MDYNQIAKDIIQDVGGKENIISAVHCADCRYHCQLR